MESASPVRDFPRSEGAIARRRTVAAALWIAAPAAWLTETRIAHLSRDAPSSMETLALLASCAALALSALGLALQPRISRILGMLGLLGAAAGLGRRAPDAPGIAFIAFAAVAVLGFGLLSLPTTRARPKFRPELVGTMWSRAVLLSSVLALLLSAAAIASEDRIFSLRVQAALELAAAGLVALAGERALAVAGRLSTRAFFFLALFTAVSTALGFLFDAGLATQALRLGYAVFWSMREWQHRPSVVRIARTKPGQVIFGSFGAGIFAGALLLSLPFASVKEGGIDFIDALFTATSALCVTGLTVINVGHDLTFAGQAVLLLLIQAGGLGIMTLSATVTLALGGSLSVRAEAVVGESAATAPTPATVARVIRTIGISTLAIEVLGTIVLFSLTYSEFDSRLEAFWYALFHSVSAFCNAGFGLDSTNLERFAERPLVLQLIAGLVIVGGLGFGVIHGLARLLADHLRRRPGPKRLDLHSQLVLTTTLVLLVSGAIGYLALEWDGVLGRFSFGDKLSNAFFQSAVLRTAGFNAINNLELGPATLLLSVVLMFIGASPGSTGGGVKTSTVAVLVLAVRNVFSQRPEVEAFGRRIDPEILSRAMAITALYVVTAGAGLVMLLLTQTARFEVLLFEVFSAIGTVGSTMGATTILDDPGKVVVVALMFLGRVGPLTAASLLSRGPAANIRLPRGEVYVG